MEKNQCEDDDDKTTHEEQFDKGLYCYPFSLFKTPFGVDWKTKDLLLICLICVHLPFTTLKLYIKSQNANICAFENM